MLSSPASLFLEIAAQFKNLKVSIKQYLLSYNGTVSSYTSISQVIVKSILWSHAFPFILDDKKYLRHNKEKWAPLQISSAIGSLLLQLLLILKWFQIQSSSAGVISKNWKQILMTVFLVLVAATCFGLLHLLRVPTETLCVFNSSIISEGKHRQKGWSKFWIRVSIYSM